MKIHKIYFSNSEIMNQLKNESVKLMITSPPYWDLKDYEVNNQIGYKEDYKTYLNRLLNVWKETYRVLSNDGIAIININTKSYNKNLVLIPRDFILQMKSIGFKFRDVHYWHKSSGIPRANNLSNHFEYFLIFSKSDEYSVNNFDYFDYKFRLKVSRANIWNINKKLGSIGKKYLVHPAIFPLEYIERMILIFTKEGETILDPFLGSGTTLIGAMKNNRKCIGYELNKRGYMPMILDRIKDNKLDFSYVSFN